MVTVSSTYFNVSLDMEVNCNLELHACSVPWHSHTVSPWLSWYSIIQWSHNHREHTLCSWPSGGFWPALSEFRIQHRTLLWDSVGISNYRFMWSSHTPDLRQIVYPNYPMWSIAYLASQFSVAWIRSAIASMTMTHHRMAHTAQTDQIDLSINSTLSLLQYNAKIITISALSTDGTITRFTHMPCKHCMYYKLRSGIT